MKSDNTYNQRIESYIKALAEVEPDKTVESVLEYYKDMTEDFIKKDISIKENVGAVYTTITSKYPELTYQNKLQVYKMLLLLTMGFDDLSSIESLDETQKNDILTEFNVRVLPVIKS